MPNRRGRRTSPPHAGRANRDADGAPRLLLRVAAARVRAHARLASNFKAYAAAAAARSARRFFLRWNFSLRAAICASDRGLAFLRALAWARRRSFARAALASRRAFCASVNSASRKPLRAARIARSSLLTAFW